MYNACVCFEVTSVINTRIKRGILKTRNPFNMEGSVSWTWLKILHFYPQKLSGITQKPLKIQQAPPWLLYGMFRGTWVETISRRIFSSLFCRREQEENWHSYQTSKDSRHFSLHGPILSSTRHFMDIHIPTAPWTCDQIVIGFLFSNYCTMHQSKSNNLQTSIEKHQIIT